LLLFAALSNNIDEYVLKLFFCQEWYTGSFTCGNNLKGDILLDSQHRFICSPSDSIVSEDAGSEPWTVATLALKARRPNHYSRSHPHLWKIVHKQRNRILIENFLRFFPDFYASYYEVSLLFLGFFHSY